MLECICPYNEPSLKITRNTTEISIEMWIVEKYNMSKNI